MNDDIITVRITAHQTAALLQELNLNSDALAGCVADRELVGTPDQLREVARRVEAIAGTAAALGQKPRAKHMSNVLSRLAAHDVHPRTPAGDARVGVAMSTVPRLRGNVHSSTARKYERRLDALSERDLDQADAGYDVSILRKGRPAGSRSAKRKLRASTGENVLRGDRTFWHTARSDEPAIVVDGVRIAPNDDRAWEQTAGTRSGDASASLDRRRAGARAMAATRCRHRAPWRVREAAQRLHAAHRRVTPGAVARLMVTDDMRVKRYEYRSQKMIDANASYQATAKQIIPTLNLGRLVEPGGHAEMLKERYKAPKTKVLRRETVVTPVTGETHRVVVRAPVVKATPRDIDRVKPLKPGTRRSAAHAKVVVETRKPRRRTAKAVAEVEALAKKLSSIAGYNMDDARRRAARTLGVRQAS